MVKQTLRKKIMGYSSTLATSTKEVFEQVKASWNKTHKVINSRKVGNNCWFVIECNDGERFIALTMIEKINEYYMTKDFKEDSFPYQWNCPFNFIKEAKRSTLSEGAKQWRDIMEKNAQVDNEVKKHVFQVGDKITIGKVDYEFIRKSPLSGYMVSYKGDTYRATSKQVNDFLRNYYSEKLFG